MARASLQGSILGRLISLVWLDRFPDLFSLMSGSKESVLVRMLACVSLTMTNKYSLSCAWKGNHFSPFLNFQFKYSFLPDLFSFSL
jgi:hypothetical protein